VRYQIQIQRTIHHMDKNSTLLSLVAHLYDDNRASTPEVIAQDPLLLQEWEDMKIVKSALEQEPLYRPSDTSVQIIMAYALGKEEAAPSY
jgi:hypothetical protein